MLQKDYKKIMVPMVVTSAPKATTAAPKSTTVAEKKTTEPSKTTTESSKSPCAKVKKTSKSKGLTIGQKTGIVAGSVAGATALAAGIVAIVEANKPGVTNAPFLAMVGGLPTLTVSPVPVHQIIVKVPIEVEVPAVAASRLTAPSSQLYHKDDQAAGASAPTGLVISMITFAFFGLVFLAISGFLYVSNRSSYAQMPRSFSREMRSTADYSREGNYSAREGDYSREIPTREEMMVSQWDSQYS